MNASAAGVSAPGPQNPAMADNEQTVEESGGHFGVAEDAGPFTEHQVSRHNHRSLLVETADQVEQPLAPGLREWQVAEGGCFSRISPESRWSAFV
jgi:hypothetical protein